MTFTQAQAESLYNQVLDLQAALVRRGELHPTAAHEITDVRDCADGQILVECTCGRGMFRDSDDDAQGSYAAHVAKALGLQIRWSRAA